MYKVLYLNDGYLDVVSFDQYWDAVDFAEENEPSEVLIAVTAPAGCEHWEGTNTKHKRNLVPNQVGFVCGACSRGYAFTNISKKDKGLV